MVLSGIMLAGATALAAAQDGQATPRSYEACAALAAEDAAAGLVYAEAWQADGGARAARHCAAVAALGLGKGVSAGHILNDLAATLENDPGAAAGLYVQAAEAFMAGGARDDAFAALDMARGIAPGALEIDMAAVGVYATAAHWPGVVDAIDALEAAADLSADAYALRGRARFEIGHYQGAANDAARALRLDPYLIDAIVLRGDLLNRGQALPNDPLLEGTPQGQ